jgi:serine/threonine protein kinase
VSFRDLADSLAVRGGSGGRMGTSTVDGRFLLLGQATRSGGGGDVRRAIDLEDPEGRHVAIKFVRSTHPDDPLAQKQFDREVSSLVRLQTPSPHPNIVELISAGFDRERQQQYIALEWIDDDLQSLRLRKPWKTWDDFADDIALPLAEALSYAHLREVQHRDIKPSNVLVADGVPKLADFGIAKRQDILEEAGMTLIEAFTRPYSPPDKGVGAEYTRDVWALAVLFMQAMWDREITDYPHIYEALNDIDVPSDVRSLMWTCVDPDPQVRPQNGSVFASQIAGIQARRAQMKARKGAVVSLVLTHRATELIMGKEGRDRDAAQQRMAIDLSVRWFARYQIDRTTSEVDRATLEVFGKEWRYILKFDPDQAIFKVTFAQLGNPDYHAKDCAKAEEVTGLVDLTFRRTPKVTSEVGARRLLDAMEAHLQRQEAEKDEAARRGVENAYFDQLIELLTAREELAQGDRRPLQYRGRRIRGREVEFDLVTQLEQDLSGQEWDVKGGRNRRIARGEVIGQGSSTLTILLSRFPREIPEQGQLAPNLGATQVAHDRQVEAVERIRDGAAVRPDLRELLIDPALIRPPVVQQPTVWLHGGLDADKRAAVGAALGAKDFLLVEGPPGTGKTTFISEVVSQLLRSAPDARVLIVSQTHVAVDNALERIAHIVGSGVVRLGRPDDPRVAETVHPLLLDQQMRRWAAGIKTKAAKFVKNIAGTFQVEESHIWVALELERLGAVLREITGALAAVEEPPPSVGEERASTGISQLTDRVAAQERLDWLGEQRDQLLEYLRGELPSQIRLSSDPSRDDVDRAVDALLGHTQLPPNILSVLRLQGEWLQRIESDEHLASVFLRTARVVAGTCVGFLGHRAVRDLEFDLCILDEASKATATEALVPLARSRRWILVGDTNQLPPMDEEILREPELMERHGLTREQVEQTLFERLVRLAPSPVRHPLAQQYRMIRPIGDLVSACFYDDALRSPRSDGIEDLDRLTKPVLWLDTCRHGPNRFEERATGTSHLNRLEARIAVDRLKVFDAALSSGFIKPPKGTRLSVLLMAPYRRQIEELEREVARLNPVNLDVLVKSVDAVQGRESDLGIFCVTRNNRQGNFGFLAQPYWRRINVALSRARFSLTIVGDAEFCYSQPGALHDVLEYIRAHPADCEVRYADVDRD